MCLALFYLLSLPLSISASQPPDKKNAIFNPHFADVRTKVQRA